MPSLTDAARSLGLDPDTLRQQVAKRKLRAFKMGGRWYVSDEEIRRYRAESLRPKDAA